MKKKMINLLLIGVIFVFMLIFLSSNIHELFSPFNNKNNSTDIADISKEDIFGTNFKNDENIENNSKEDDIENNHIEYTPKKDIPIVNGKVLSDIYSIDIVNYNIMKDFYGWTDDESLLNYYMFENSILFHTRQDGKYEIIPESIIPFHTVIQSCKLVLGVWSVACDNKIIRIFQSYHSSFSVMLLDSHAVEH